MVLKTLVDNSIDALCCDPPAGISFMSKDWDCFRRKNNPNDAGRENVFGRTSAHAPHSYGESDRGRFIAFLTPIFEECLRILKPGAHGLVWALPRTSHWTATALEDAGFEIREIVHHHFSTGFPKGHDIAKAIDKEAGAERAVLGTQKRRDIRNGRGRGRGEGIDAGQRAAPEYLEHAITAPATEDARRWEGWNTAMKPATEHWILVRKPLEKGTVAANVLAYGTGAINVDACRVGRAAEDTPGWHESGAKGSGGYQGTDTFKIHDMSPEEIQARCGGKGRWPANLVLSHSPDCVLVGTRKVKGCPAEVVQGGKDGGGYDVGSSDGTRHTVFQGYGDEEGMEEVEVYACTPDCPIRRLDDQGGVRKSGKAHFLRRGVTTGKGMGYGSSATVMDVPNATYGDQGGASRFFYCPKPSRSEKNAGVQGGNRHPTVKAVTLMRYLCRLICPPGGVIVDPFMGSGSTGVAAIWEGFDFLGIEQDAESYATARARLAYAEKEIG